MESRFGNVAGQSRKSKGTELPPDFLKMVNEVFSNNFEEGLKALNALKPNTQFVSQGAIFPNEILLSVSLVHENELAATTAHASVDFDPKASSPTAQDLLGSCVDALGALFLTLLDPEKPQVIAQIADESLAALEDAPFEWTAISASQRAIYVKVDKSNPSLETMTDEWLLQNDPHLLEREAKEEKVTEELFVTGPKKNTSNGDGDDGAGGTGYLH